MSAIGLHAAEIAAEFPVLRREFGGRPLAYLDSAATSQTPQSVIDAITDYYTRTRASVHRGVYPLAAEATERFEDARARIARWLRSTPAETIFTANATAAINLVAYAWGLANLHEGDLVVLTEMEHHSNIVPWQIVAAQRGAELAYVELTEDGQLDPESLEALLARGPKLLGVAHVSNVLGTINPVAEIVAKAHAAGAKVLVDGTQAVPQIPVDLAAIDADFYAWTGHKAYGPTGVGVLHGRRELLEQMPPFLGGGHMIHTVSRDRSTWAELPWKYEAGTSQIAEVIGLGAAVDWLDTIGLDAVREHERALVATALERLDEQPDVTVHGPGSAADRGAVISFALDGAHPHDIAEILGREGVCVRAGHHCAQILMRRLGTAATARASLAVHTTPQDVDRLIAGLDTVRRVMRL